MCVSSTKCWKPCCHQAIIDTKIMKSINKSRTPENRFEFLLSSSSCRSVLNSHFVINENILIYFLYKCLRTFKFLDFKFYFYHLNFHFFRNLFLLRLWKFHVTSIFSERKTFINGTIFFTLFFSLFTLFYYRVFNMNIIRMNFYNIFKFFKFLNNQKRNVEIKIRRKTFSGRKISERFRSTNSLKWRFFFISH